MREAREGTGSANGHGSNASGERPPTTTPARILAVLDAHADYMTVRDVLTMLEQSGWKTASPNKINIVRNALIDMEGQHKVVKRKTDDGGVEYASAWVAENVSTPAPNPEGGASRPPE